MNLFEHLQLDQSALSFFRVSLNLFSPEIKNEIYKMKTMSNFFFI